MTRPTVRTRTTSLLVTLVGAALALTGCAAQTTAADDVAPSSDTAGFPVTIDTAYGEVTVAEAPERIVALSGRHLELLTALDETPVAFADYTSDDEQFVASYPWLEGTYEGEPDPNLFTAEYQPSPEAIAALEPDLILTNIWQTDEKVYEQLSQIAPTYVGIETDTNTAWQDDLTALAALTGHDEQVVDDAEAELDSALSAATEKLAGLQGKSFYVAALGDGEQLWLTEYAAAPLLGLGLEPGDGQPVEGSEAADAPTFSQENIDQLTADVVLIAAENRDPSGEFRAALEADPRLAELPASKNGTLIFLDPGQWNAVNGGTATSLIWWLDQIEPVLDESELNRGAQ
jgi:iron complex transport system substrate-binding protein